MSSGGPYRDLPPVDAAAVEVARIQAAEETKRQRQELLFRAAEDRRQKLAQFLNYDGTMLVLFIVTALAIGTVCAIAIMFCYARWYR